MSYACSLFQTTSATNSRNHSPNVLCDFCNFWDQTTNVAIILTLKIESIINRLRISFSHIDIVRGKSSTSYWTWDAVLF